ncbi:hypothetical protein Droror1_Dr00026602 [Drosera rotundifolia]
MTANSCALDSRTFLRIPKPHDSPRLLPLCQSSPSTLKILILKILCFHFDEDLGSNIIVDSSFGIVLEFCLVKQRVFELDYEVQLKELEWSSWDSCWVVILFLGFRG